MAYVLLLVIGMLAVGFLVGIILNEKFVFRVERTMSGYIKDAFAISGFLIWIYLWLLTDKDIRIRDKLSLFAYTIKNTQGLVSIAIKKLKGE